MVPPPWHPLGFAIYGWLAHSIKSVMCRWSLQVGRVFFLEYALKEAPIFAPHERK